jgi:hypothetical protein
VLEYIHHSVIAARILFQSSGIPSFLGMGEVDPDVWHLKCLFVDVRR